MNIDFPLILLVATFLTGAVVLLDRFWLAQRRQLQAQRLAAQGAYEDDVHAAVKESFWVEQSKSFFPVLAIVFVLRSFIAEPFQIPSGSMEPGLIPGDFILVSKFHFGLRMPVWGQTLVPVQQPQRGDVMVFFPPDDPRYFIKRVIGLPGDHVRYRDRQLWINGEAVETSIVGAEPRHAPTRVVAQEHFDAAQATVQWVNAIDYQTQQPVLWAGPEGEWQVPEGHYFTMGDNRGNSADSRSWGMVPERNVVGKAVAIWMHWESWSSLPSFKRNGWID